ncbi:DUF11 domain-containing protein [Patescibacteria group bacterium]|nr:DUF11 domain-containing protein [Patescibacteria group bacterium]
MTVFIFGIVSFGSFLLHNVANALSAPVLSVLKTVNEALVNPSGTLSYTVVVNNSGTGEAKNVMLVDTLPAGLTFANEDGSNSGDTTKEWSLGNLAAGQDTSVKYMVLVDSNAGVGTYANTVIATSYEDNNETVIATSEPATASTEVRIPVVLGEETPSLIIEKSVMESFVNPGGTVSYAINISNYSSAIAFDAVLDDALPAGFTYVDNGKTTMSWDLGDVTPGETVTINYTVNVGIDVIAGDYVNVATTSADDVDAISDDASIEVRAVEVLGAEDEDELPVTGGGIALLLITGALGLVAVGGRYIRKR